MKVTISVQQRFRHAEMVATCPGDGFRDASRFATLGGDHPALDSIVGPVRHTVVIERAFAKGPDQ